MSNDTYFGMFAFEWTPTVKLSEEGLEREIREGAEGIELDNMALAGGDFFSDLDDAARARAVKAAKEVLPAMLTLYRYAVEGRYLPGWLDDDLPDDYMRIAKIFARRARDAAEEHNLLVPVQCEKVIAMTQVRAGLDQAVRGVEYMALRLGEPLHHVTLFEIAVLAQMNEKSVRNATQPNAPDRLLTMRQGTRTVVAATEAMAWLCRRRSFTPTQHPESDS